MENTKMKLTGKPSIDKPWLQFYPEQLRNVEVPKMTIEEFLKYKNQDENRTAFEYYGNKIIGVEIWNEPNVKWFSNQAMNWYSLMVQKVNCLNFNNVVSGATATPYQTEKSEQYIQEIANNGAYVNSKAFSYHVYSSSENMKWLKKNL